MYYIDKNSRYFCEDFNYGLLIIKAFAEICSIKTPYIDRIIKWYASLVKENVIQNDKLVITQDSFVPQNFGINTVDDIVKFYEKTTARS